MPSTAAAQISDAVTPAMLIDVEIVACDVARDGELIRALTRDNFYAAMRPAVHPGRQPRGRRLTLAGRF